MTWDCVTDLSPSIPNSTPRPEPFTPPNGTIGWLVSCWSIHTVPAWMREAIARALSGSLDPDRCAKTRIAPVRARDRGLHIAVADDGQHRAELLLFDEAAAVRDPGDQRHRIEIADAAGFLATAHDGSAVGPRVFDQRHHLVALHAVLDRPGRDAGVHAAAHRHGFRERLELGDQPTTWGYEAFKNNVVQASYIVHVLAPWFIHQHVEAAREEPKLYFCDVGLACWLVGLRCAEQVARGPLLSSWFENLVIMEALKTRFNQGESAEMYFSRDATGNEVDLPIPSGRKLRAVEIKAGATVNTDYFRGLRSFSAAWCWKAEARSTAATLTRHEATGR